MRYAALLQFFNLCAFGGAFALSWILTSLAERFAHYRGLLDYPSDRKAHKHPTPFLGGVAVALAFWLVVLVGIFAVYKVYPDEVQAIFPYAATVMPKVGGIFTGSLVMLAVGFFDDKYGMPPFVKLAFQTLGAAILMYLGLTINLVASLGPFGYLITFLWILLIMNAFNFIDSLDGHCAGIALISAITFFWITVIIGQPMVGLALAAFSGALLGFLPHNTKPAKIFLGDNGSLFIGYIMAAFTLLGRYQTLEATYATLFIPVLVFGVPIYDTLSVITVRLSRGLAPWQGDRNHFAHRLVKIGMSERVAVVFSYFIAVTIGLVALLTTQVTFFGAVLIGCLFVSIIGVIAFLEYYAMKRVRLIEHLSRMNRRRLDDLRDAEERP